MDPADIGFLKAVVAFIVVAGTSLTAVKLWLRARTSAAALPHAALDALREEQDEYRAITDARIAELEERLDFAERRLVQDADPLRRIEPPMHTPV